MSYTRPYDPVDKASHVVVEASVVTLEPARIVFKTSNTIHKASGIRVEAHSFHLESP